MIGKIKSGLEIHQQLDTHKLFCNCPSLLRGDEPQFEVRRKLHAVAGESGEVDVAAKFEAEQEKEFIYQGYDTTCLIELDEEPPHEINQEALEIALHIALLLNCEILPIVQIMRKTVVDGSNTSGFQRTMLIARNGYVETKKGKVGINAVMLEEDSARPSSGSRGENNEDNSNVKVYKLDRLGLPLVEIATDPDITSPEQAKEVALHLGDILRSCKVRRGIGTIRQDVNISIEGHPRVEIKGFQDVKMFISTIEKEVERQKRNLEDKKDLKSEVRNALEDGSSKFSRPMPGASRMYPETDLPLLKISREMIDEAKKNLPRLRSDVKGELEKSGLHGDWIMYLINNELIDEYKSLLEVINEPKFIGKVLIELPKEISAHEGIENIDGFLSLDVIESIVHGVKDGKIERDDIKHIMMEIVKGRKFEDAIKIEKADLGDVEEEIAKMVKEKPGLSIGGYMGLVMAKFKGQVSGKEVSAILSKLIK